MTTKISKLHDIINQIAYAKKEGRAEGLAEGVAKGEAKVAAEKEAIARNLKARGMDIDEIAEITALSRETIASL